MSILSQECFFDEAAAFQYVEKLIWAEGRKCPHCETMNRSYPLKGVRSKPSKKHPEGIVRHGLYKCRDCEKQFTVRNGTIFEESHLPLHKWLQAIHLMCSSKKGISAHQLHRILEIQYKTAWFLAHRIRETMRSANFSPMGGSGKIVEIDETYIGRLEGAPPQKSGGSQSYKNTILTLVERGGQARSFHVGSTTIAEIVPIIEENLKRETVLMTDAAPWYRRVGRDFVDHQWVDHGSGEYARGKVSTNTVEGFYSIFKRGMKGVYQHCKEKHLHRYLAEFDFRYNHRAALGINDTQRFLAVIASATGKRLTYQRST